MKKNLLLGFLIIFLLSATAFAGFAYPKNESEKSATTNLRENKLSDEELSRMSKRAEIDNLSRSTLSNKDMNDSKNNLKASNQIIVEEHHHHGYYYGGGLLLVVILVIVLI
jgi:Flp pilus assembly protein TadB